MRAINTDRDLSGQRVSLLNERRTAALGSTIAAHDCHEGMTCGSMVGGLVVGVRARVRRSLPVPEAPICFLRERTDEVAVFGTRPRRPADRPRCLPFDGRGAGGARTRAARAHQDARHRQAARRKGRLPSRTRSAHRRGERGPRRGRERRRRAGMHRPGRRRKARARRSLWRRARFVMPTTSCSSPRCIRSCLPRAGKPKTPS